MLNVGQRQTGKVHPEDPELVHVVGMATHVLINQMVAYAVNEDARL